MDIDNGRIVHKCQSGILSTSALLLGAKPDEIYVDWSMASVVLSLKLLSYVNSILEILKKEMTCH